jgi:peptidoglycan-N-acetylglucosamine deacetylase
VIRAVKQAGYVGARTTELLAHKLDFAPFEMPTTVQAYPHLRSDYLRNLARARKAMRALEWTVRFRHIKDWIELGRQFFDLVLQEGGVWHLLGHSWEIEEMHLWDALAEIFDYVAGREGVLYLNNVEVLGMLPHKPPGLVLKEHETSAR